MWRIPFLQADPALGYVADLNKIFVRLTGEWMYDPKQGFQCEVPVELAGPYCAAMNQIAGETIATQKESHDIAAMRPFAMDLAVITLDARLLVEKNLLDLLGAAGGNQVFQEIFTNWSSRTSGSLKSEQFAFYNPRPRK